MSATTDTAQTARIGTDLTNSLQTDYGLNTGVTNGAGEMVINAFFNHSEDASNPDTVLSGGYTVLTTPFNAYERGQFELAHAIFESFLAVDFNIVSDQSQADFIYNPIAASPGLGGVFNLPNGSTSQVLNGVFNTTSYNYSNAPGGGLDQGGRSFVTIIHELGHGLGLDHPHDATWGATVMPGVSSSSDLGTFDLNQGIYTTMSYNAGWETNPDGFGFASGWGWQGTPMALDIAVLQDFYGANTSFASGNDTYSLPDLNGSGTFFSCIWDTGGFDTIAYSGARNVAIDLRAATLELEPGGGGWVSWAQDVRGGFTIANGVEIEAARGGAGNDTLSSNEHDNWLTGGAGADTFFFFADAGPDRDTITDFVSGLDRIDVDDLLPDLNPLSVLAAITFKLIGGDAVITYGTEQIVIEGVTDWSQIQQSDFVLV